MIDKKTLDECKQNKRSAQRKVYDELAKPLYHTCKRYLSREDEIQDVLAESFYTIFTKLHQLKNPQAFEGWARKIVVNRCLLSLRKQVNFTLYLEDTTPSPAWAEPPSTSLENEDLLQLVEALPRGCQTVFNLYVIEGYSHKEIADELNVSVGTSKSQLNVAKTKLQALVNQFYFTQSQTK